MNAVFQVILNLDEVRSVFSHPDFHKCVNIRNKSGKEGKVIKEFLNIFKEKWNNEQTITLNLRKFKEIVSEINPQYNGNDQHDAHDFLNFILDILHEEINLKSEKEFIMNPEVYNGSEVEFANEFWANNLRRNFSFIHSFFLGQLKSNLTCRVCDNSKVQYETFISLNLPISQRRKIWLNIILHRLPFTFKIYYNDLENKSEKYFKMKENEMPKNERENLNMIRRKSLDLSLYENNENEGTTVNTFNDDQKENNKLVKLLNGQNLSVNHTYFYTSKLTTSIPLKLLIEIDRKQTVESLIEMVKSFDDLFLDKIGKFTEYIVYDYKEIINKKFQIDECFQHNQTIHIFELLNTSGISRLFNYEKDEEEAKLVKLNELALIHFNKNISYNEPYKQGKI